MRVVVINAEKGWADGVKPPFKEGEVIEVSDDGSQNVYDKTYKSGAWDASRFMSTSEIEENEIHNVLEEDKTVNV